MTQRLVFVGLQMAFQTIGFHTALILNKLRNKEQIEADSRADADRGSEHYSSEQKARAEFVRLNDRLIVLNKKLGTETPRVEPIASGGSAISQTKRNNV